MAKLYGEIASSALMTFDKSFARANGQPLDSTEVYYSLAAAKEYAAGAGAYVGQKIAVVENNVVTHYSIEDAAGNLKELGSKPVGDEKSITVAENGTVSLVGVGSLVFERDILGEDGEPTGEKEEVNYQPLMTSAGLVWVEPSKTTVEGLATLIDALTNRVKALEDNSATKAELQAAEKSLTDKINAIDFVDEEELAAARELISKEIDDDVKVAKDRADEAYILASGKVDTTTYNTDKKALEDEDAAIRAIAEDAKASIDTFMTSQELDETVNTLKEIQTELDKMADATEMVEALAKKADITYVDQELGKKQDTIPENTYDAYGAAATAKSEAISEAATAAAGIYATQTALNGLDTRVGVLEGIDHTLYATKEELSAHENTASATYATKEELAPVKQTADNAAAKVETLEDKIEEITSVGGEPNVIDYIKVNGTIVEVEKDAEGKSTKTVNIDVPTKFTDITDDSGFDARITEAQNAANAAQSTANNAVSLANTAQGEVDALEGVVGGISTTVASHTSTIGEHTTKIANLETFQSEHTALYNSLKDTVTGHGTAIASKAEQADLNATNAKVAANEAAIKTINETTIVAINGEIAKKADATALDNYYTKTDIGTIEEGKTLVDMINATIYNDSEVKKSISDEVTRAKAEEERLAGLISDNATAIAGNTAVINSILGNEDETGLNSIAELAAWINEHGEAADGMVESIQNNAEAIAAINDGTNGILATAKAYTDTKISEIPAATKEALGLVKFDDNTIKMNESEQLYVAKVSTDILEMGTMTLVLSGGSATEN